MPSTSGGEQYARLGRLVQERMRHVGYDNPNAVERAGGPTWDTVVKVLKGDLTRITTPTITRLETALRWPTGTIRGILNGEDPPEDRITLELPRGVAMNPADLDALTEFLQQALRERWQQLGDDDGLRRGEEQ